MSLMHTCHFETCKFAKEFFSDREECFNYKATWWTPTDGGEPIMIYDCAPIRTLIMVQELANGQIRLQKAQEQQRDRSDIAVRGLKEIIDAARERRGIKEITE
jgi:hypothetical protein